MHRRSLLPRARGALLAIGAGVALIGALPTAGAAPAAPESTTGVAAPVALNENGAIAADGAASLLTVDIPSLSPAILPQTNVDLAPSAARAASDQDLDPDKSGAQRSAALGGVTFGSNLLGAPLDLQSNGASAPASEVNEDTLIPLDLLPLLDLPVINSRAEANWVSDVECVASDTPMSLANQTLADVVLLEPAAGQSVVNLNTAPGEGAVDTEVATSLVSIDGGNDRRAVQGEARTNISSADVLNGLAGPGSVIHADVVQAPHFIARASGLNGGASVTGQRPVVEVSIAGEPLITLDAQNPTVDATLTDLVLGDLIDLSGPGLLSGADGLLADLGLGALTAITEPIEDAVQTLLSELQPIVRISMPYSETVAADGTSASVEGALLRVEVLAPAAVGAAGPVADIVNQILGALGADLSGPLVEVNLAPMSASATAPAGGIECGTDDNPLRELNKHASATEVAPGGVFEYNIAVPNRGPCALTDVVVTDTVTGPGEIIDTEPDATVDGNTATWNIGDLAVNETVNLTITVRVDASAAPGTSFDDTVLARAKCNGRDIEQPDSVNDIPRVVDNFEGPCNVGFSNKDASHIQVTEGQTFSYYVHAFNSGGDPCTEVEITDTLDERLTFVSCNKGCTNEGQEVSWTVDEIPGGSSVILSVVVSVNDGATGTLANSAIIDPGNGDPKTVSTTGPEIGDQSIPKDPNPADRGDVGGPRKMPPTGIMSPAGLATLLGAGALGLLALRRRAALV